MTRDEVFQAILALVPQAERDGINTVNNKPLCRATS